MKIQSSTKQPRIWAQLRRRFFEPHPRITDPDERWRAGLLAALLLPLTTVTLIGAIAMWFGAKTPPWAHLVSVGLLVAAMALSQTRHAAIGGFLAVLGFAEPSFWIAFAKQHTQPEEVSMALVWMAEATVVSVLVLPVVRSILCNVSLLIGIGALLWSIHPNPEIRAFPPMSFLAVFTMLSAVAAVLLHRSRQGLYEEIRERKRAEQALQSVNEQLEERVRNRTIELRRLNEALAAVVSSSPAAVVMLNLDGTVELWNEAATRIFGWAEADIVGHPNPIFPNSGESRLSQPFGVGSRDEPHLGLELSVRAKDGRLVEILLSTAPLRDSEGHPIGVAGVALDLTQQRLLENQFRHAQKMEAIGRLAGGVAHDFNNLLTVINGSAAMLRDELEDNEPAQSMASEVLDAGQRAAALTRQLLAFSRKQTTKKETLELNDVIESLSKMIRRLIGPTIELVLRQAPDLRPVEADRGQIEQVILNLVVNASDAMPEGGTLTIACANANYNATVFREGTIWSIPRAVALSVSDTGSGMSEQTKQKIFEPFFTTKDPGKGTGLGLATVYGIIANQGGAVEVDSEIGQGTTFHLYIPSSEISLVQQTHEAIESFGGDETILVIEDVQAVRTLAGRMLERLGYKVFLASGWQAAKEIYERRSQRIDLVLSDVVMPGVSGPECVRRLKEINPDQLVLFMSGRAERAGEMLLVNDSTPLLEKPFDMIKLARAIHAVLPEKLHKDS